MANAANLPPPQNVAVLTGKLYDVDPDIRYMSLNDLNTLLNSNAAAFLLNDYHQCAKTVDGFLNTLNDPNGEVQNLTIKCLGIFVLKTEPQILCPLIHKVADQTIDNAVDTSISAMALRTIVVSLPRPDSSSGTPAAVQNAYSAISAVLIPRLVGYIVIPRGDKARPRPPKGLLEEDLQSGKDSNSIDILVEIAKCFGPMLQQPEVKALQDISLRLLESPKSGSVMKKKAVAAIAALSHFFSDSLLSSVSSHIIESLRAPHLTPTNRRLYINVLGSMARAIPGKFGPHLKTLAPFVLSALSQEELDEQSQAEEESEQIAQLDEVREAALVALESFLASCSADMISFNNESLAATLRFLKYDPNFADDDDDLDAGADEEDDFDLDEDFEQDVTADDEDDVSWKVRRCAAKTLHTMVAVRSKELLESSEAFNRIARALLDRFKEREENVRLEVVQTLAFLVRHSAQHEESDALVSALHVELARNPVLGSELAQTQQPSSRKRRRGNSDVSMADHAKYRRLTGSVSPESQSPVPPGAPQNLAKLGTEVVQSALKLANSTNSPPTRVAAISLLKDFVVARRGGTDDSLKEVFDLLTAHISAPATSQHLHTGASAGSLQIETLQLLSEVAKATPSSLLQPYMAKVVPSVIAVAKNRTPQLACEALRTSEQLIKAMTPPRTAHATSKASASQLDQLLDGIIGIASSRGSDLVTRQQAIAVLGTLLGRTLSSEGSKLIQSQKRQTSLELISDSIKNETTRYASIKAVDAMANQAPDPVELDHAWFTSTCIELGNQLRKADRALRGASLSALRTLIVERKGSGNLTDAPSLIGLLMPLLETDDLHMLGPCLIIFAALIRDSQAQVISDVFVKSICRLLMTPTASMVQDQLSEVVECAGQRGVGKPLMQALLKDVGVNGSPAVVGKIIGDLLTSSKDGAGMKIDAFLEELKSAPDEKRKCLALSVIGEVGLRSGSSSTLQPDLFVSYLAAKSDDVPIAAAIALGRAAAGAGNVHTYVPVILSRTGKSAKEQYLILHCIKEMLQYNENVQDMVPFTGKLWEASISAADNEQSRTVGAECIANLAIIEPKTYLPSLQALLSDKSSSVHGTAILALRDVFTATDSSYNKYLRPIIIDVLSAAMRDSLPENRRSALNTFNAASRNKPELILPHLNQLMPLILDQTFEDPSLIREVSMGPFKHKVDDGLEVRKGAYETLYSLLELTPTLLQPLLSTIFPRIIAGLGDDASIRALCNLMVVKLSAAAPDETAPRLDDIAERFRATLAVTLKETAVRLEQERTEEGKRAVVKVSLEVQRRLGERAGTAAGAGGAGAKWTAYMEDVRKDWAPLVKEMEKEMRERA